MKNITENTEKEKITKPTTMRDFLNDNNGAQVRNHN